MNWNLLALVPPIMLGVLLLVMLYGVVQMWKVNRKFLAFIFLALAAAIGIMLYAIYGNKIFG